jgi:hypothetical protein
MIPLSTIVLRDRILALARFRGVFLEEACLVDKRWCVSLRIRIGGVVLRGCEVRLPTDVKADRYAVNVVTVRGSRRRSSKAWPPRRDGTYNLDAIVTHLLTLVQEELASTRRTLTVASGVPDTASGVHVIHAAAVHFGTMSSDTTAEAVLEAIQDVRVRGRIESHARVGGITDPDLRALGDAVGLFFGRCAKVDFDPLELPSMRHLSVLVVGSEKDRRCVPRHVLVLARSGDEITVADPAGKGLTIVAAEELRRAWRFGGLRKHPWVGSVGSKSREYPCAPSATPGRRGASSSWRANSRPSAT